MDRDIINRNIALAVLCVALAGLIHSWRVALDMPIHEGRQFTGLVAAEKKPLVTSGIKIEDPGTVGQQYQGPEHYKNHNYYTTSHDYLQGGQLYVRNHLQ